MKNLDAIKNQVSEQRTKAFNALQNGSKEEQGQAFNELFESIQNAVIEQANEQLRQTVNNNSDDEILAKRGGKALTTKEKKYFTAVIANGGFEGLQESMPETILNDVMENVKSDHELLKLLDVRSTAGLAKAIFSKPNVATAFWGEIDDEIKEMLKGAFEFIDIASKKLSGFIVLPKEVLKLGPNWLATFITESMRESMQITLEHAVVNGNGLHEPVGMLKSLTGVVDGVYSDKATVVLNDLKPATLGEKVMKPLANGKKLRGDIVMVVHPNDYWGKIFGATTTFQNGVYFKDVLPISAKIVQSEAMPEGKMVVGVAKNYLLAVSGQSNITRYTETFAVEDMDLYIAKFTGNGRPKSQESFIVFDIANLATALPVEPVTP